MSVVRANFEILLERAPWRHPAIKKMVDRVPDCVEVVIFVLTFFQLLDIFNIVYI